MVLSKNQIIISSMNIYDMKLYTIKIGKILYTYMYRLYIIAIDLELCLFTNRWNRLLLKNT